MPFILVAAAVLAACGAGAVKDPKVETACETLLSFTCDKMAECVSGDPTVAYREAVRNKCLDDLGVSFSCERAKSLGQSYEQCLSDTKTIRCDQVWANVEVSGYWQPRSCRDVIVH